MKRVLSPYQRIENSILKEFRKDFQEIQINNEKNAISFYCKLIEENTFKSKMYNNHIHKKKIRLYGLLRKF